MSERITLSAKEAAELLGVSYWKVIDLVRRHELPHIRLGGRILFRQETLLSFLAEHETKSVKTESPMGNLRKINI